MINTEKIHTSSGYVTIREGDWDYPTYMSDVTARIISDWKFDEQCRKLSINKKNHKNNGGKLNGFSY